MTFDEAVFPDDMGSLIEGFAVADASGNYRMAQAVAEAVRDEEMRNKQILVSSPLVKEPVAARYAWARSPMGNLEVEGKPWQPLHSFRTDQRDLYAEVAHSDPDGQKKNSKAIKEMRNQAKACLARRFQAETMATGEG